MFSAEINYVAVLVAAVINMVIGFIWYSKPVFGAQWMKELGRTEAEIKANSSSSVYLIPMVGALVMAYVMSFIVDYVGAVDALSGALAGFWVWLGFVATTFLSTKVFEGRSWSLYWINVGYYLFALFAMGAILAVMP